MNVREVVAVILWSIGIACVWLGPAFFGYAMHITDHDTALYYYPAFDFYAKALQSGQSFLWLPGIFSGFPIYVSQTGGFFDPINIAIFSFFSGIHGVHIRLFLDIVATVFFSYLAARSLGLSRVASGFVGPSFLLAFHMRFLSNPVIANTLFLVPLLMYVCTTAFGSRMRTIPAVCILGMGLGITLLSGYTQVVVYALFATGLYVLMRAWFFGTLGTYVFWKRGAVLVLGIGVGVVIGLPFILPAEQFLSQTARATAPSYEEATRKVVEYGDVILFAMPDHVYVPYLTSGRKPLYVGALLGGLMLAATVFALVSIREHRRYAEFCAVAITSLLLLVLSLKYSPLYYLLSKVPIFDHFRFPFRFMFVGAFFLALLGAFGFDRIAELVRLRSVRVALWLWVGFSSLLAFVILAINLLSSTIAYSLAYTLHKIATTLRLYDLAGFSKGDTYYAEAIIRALDASRELLTLRDVAIALPLTILVASTSVVALYLSGRLREAKFRSLAITITVVTVITIPTLRYKDFVPLIEAGIAPHIALAHASEEDQLLYRMYSFIPGAAASDAIPPQFKLSFEEERAIKELTVSGAAPNYHLYHALGSVDGYDQFETLDTLAAIESIGGELFAGYGAGTPEERRERLLDNLDTLAMMGGKFLISGVPLEDTRLRLLSEEIYTVYEIPLRLYVLSGARPRYYFARDIEARPHSSFQDLLSGDVSFASKTYLDCRDCAGEGSGSIVLVYQKNGYYTFTTETEGSRFLVLSESYLSGWRAWIDDKEVSLIRANGLYMAVRVPPGTHTVRFEYEGLYREIRVLKLLGLVE